MRRVELIPAIVLAALLSPARASGQDAAAQFTEHCAPCHTIGEDGGAGPDLRGIGARRDRAWLIAYVLDPEATNKDTLMPSGRDLGRDGVSAILDYIDRRSSGDVREASSPPAPEPVFTPADVARGRAIYVGRARMANGAPACLSCHDAGLDAGLGGGTLGPDLARVATRLNGAKGTSAWLSAPRTPVMRSLYGAAPLAPADVHALAAFLVDRGQPGAPQAPLGTRRFVALGLAGSVAAFALTGAAWRRRLRPVRRSILDRAARARHARPLHTHGFRSGGAR
jgi:mono/diheme cytochrome c family protein